MKYRMGDLVELVTETNSDLKYGLNDIVGVTLEKKMIPTIANLTQTDLDDFIIVHPKDFVYNPRTHGKKIGLGFNTMDRCFISTWNNNTFRVKPEMSDVIIPEFLYMHFLRERWDKEACFNAWGSSTVVLLWSSFCDMKINVPSISEQRKIVHDYQVITDRIELLRKIDTNLFQTAKAYMINLYETSDIWQSDITINDYCHNIASGGTPNRSESSYWENASIPWLKNGEIKNNVIVDTDEYISKTGLNNSSARLFPAYSIHMAMYCVSEIQVAISCIPLTTNQAVLNFELDSFREASFFYYLLATYGNEITSNANGSAQQNLSKELITAFVFKKPIIEKEQFSYFEKNLDYRISIAKELVSMQACADLVLTHL